MALNGGTGCLFRFGTGSNDDHIRCHFFDQGTVSLFLEFDRNPQCLDFILLVIQKVAHLFKGWFNCEIQLPTQPVRFLDQRNVMTHFFCGDGGFRTGRPAAHDHNFFRVPGESAVGEVFLTPCCGIDSTTNIQVSSYPCTAIFAADTFPNFIKTIFINFQWELGIGQKSPAKGDHIRRRIIQHFLGIKGIIYPSDHDDRYIDGMFNLTRGVNEHTLRNRGWA